MSDEELIDAAIKTIEAQCCWPQAGVIFDDIMRALTEAHGTAAAKVRFLYWFNWGYGARHGPCSLLLPFALDAEALRVMILAAELCKRAKPGQLCEWMTPDFNAGIRAAGERYYFPGAATHMRGKP